MMRDLQPDNFSDSPSISTRSLPRMHRRYDAPQKFIKLTIDNQSGTSGLKNKDNDFVNIKKDSLASETENYDGMYSLENRFRTRTQQSDDRGRPNYLSNQIEKDGPFNNKI